MKRSNLTIVLGLTIVAITVAMIYWLKKPPAPKRPAIALVTTMSHPALDQVREGFRAAWAIDADLLEYNAEGNAQSAQIIARQIAQQSHIVGILTIGTLATQSMAKLETSRPIVMAAVSDPYAIVADGATNICGLTDAIDAAYQLNVIKKLLPHIKSLSVLYSPHELNSSSMVRKLENARPQDLTLHMIGVHESQHIAAASLSACKKSDAVLIPLDNQLVAAMPLVIKATKNYPCPIIASNESPIHQGATIAFGVDYVQMGRKAAIIMTEIYHGTKTPADMGFVNPDNLSLYVNEHVVKEKGIHINPDMPVTMINPVRS